MNLKYISLVIISMVAMSGCGNHPTPPADLWGGVGFAYEAQNDTSGHIHGSGATTVIGFEKQLGGGLGIGGEVGG